MNGQRTVQTVKAAASLESLGVDVRLDGQSKQDGVVIETGRDAVGDGCVRSGDAVGR